METSVCGGCGGGDCGGGGGGGCGGGGGGCGGGGGGCGGGGGGGGCGGGGGADVVCSKRFWSCKLTRMQLFKWAGASAPTPSAGLTSRQKPYAFSLRKQVPGVPKCKHLTQLQVEEKDCEARQPHPPLLRRKGSAIFSIALTLSAPGPEC